MDFFNYVGAKFSELGDKILSWLPTSPIVYLQADAEIKKYLGYVNWFIPIYSIISVLETWLVCVLLWYVVQVILRWLKVTE